MKVDVKRRDYSKAVDVWSFGAVLYKLIYNIDAFDVSIA